LEERISIVQARPGTKTGGGERRRRNGAFVEEGRYFYLRLGYQRYLTEEKRGGQRLWILPEIGEKGNIPP